jgi:hypothetical protein
VKNETPINLPETAIGRFYFVLASTFVVLLVAGTIFTSPLLYGCALTVAILSVLFALAHWVITGRD